MASVCRGDFECNVHHFINDWATVIWIVVAVVIALILAKAIKSRGRTPPP